MLIQLPLIVSYFFNHCGPRDNRNPASPMPWAYSTTELWARYLKFWKKELRRHYNRCHNDREALVIMIATGLATDKRRDPHQFVLRAEAHVLENPCRCRIGKYSYIYPRRSVSCELFRYAPDRPPIGFSEPVGNDQHLLAPDQGQPIRGQTLSTIYRTTARDRRH